MVLVRYSITFLLMVSLSGMNLGRDVNGLSLESRCYLTNTSYDQECDGNNMLDVHFTNGSTSGAVIAEVVMPPISCNFSNIIVILVQKVTHLYCYVEQETFKHSWKYFRRLKCESHDCPNACGKFSRFTFYHVQTGLYYLDVRAMISESNYIEYVTPTKEIVTDFNKTWATHLTNEITPSVERGTVSFHLRFNNPTSEVKIILKHSDGSTMSQLNVDSSKLKDHSVKKICNITLEEDEPRHIGKMTGISCKYKTSENITRMKVVYLNEDRCDNEIRMDRENLLGTDCVCDKNEEYDLLVIESELPKPYSTVFIAFMVIFVFLVAALGVLSAINILRKRPANLLTSQKDEVTTHSLIVKDIEILLLYARDCPQFMKVMKSLKRFLETNYNIQVHDCYDESNHDVLNGPEEWFQLLMRKVGLRTIIVTTRCAYLQQEAAHINIMGLYQQPEFLDHFFMYGLSHIKQDFSRDIYRKIYVVQINGFDDDVELKYLPTALTRYKLPEHLDKLLTDMSCIRSNEVTLRMDLKVEGAAYEELMKSFDTLKSFKRANDKYLHQMLSLLEV